MALTRKFLSALGIEADKIDEIIDAHTETVNALKKERDTAKTEAATYKADAEKLPGVQRELDDLKADNSDNPYKDKYEKEHSDFEKYKADVTAKETKEKKVSALKSLLKEVGVSEKRIDAIVKVSSVDEIEFDNDNKIKDSDKLKDKLKKEWEGFIVTEEQKGAETSTPPAKDNKGGKAPSRAAQLAAKYNQNLYGGGEKKGE